MATGTDGGQPDRANGASAVARVGAGEAVGVPAIRRGRVEAVAQLPWGQPINTDKPTEPLQGVQAIHEGAMRILEEIGIEFLNEEAKSYLRSAGCDVDSDSNNVRMDRAIVMEQVAKAPDLYITPRDPARTVQIGGGHMALSTYPAHLTVRTWTAADG